MKDRDEMYDGDEYFQRVAEVSMRVVSIVIVVPFFIAVFIAWWGFPIFLSIYSSPAFLLLYMFHFLLSPLNRLYTIAFRKLMIALWVDIV